ncbi:hypothetical protein CMUS01_16782 [Colletotrichum musicola]|uniref:Nucleic-acid-binding protein from transposon X-element n=1 Tax=Colletotrichum musicola TaxID=2175873 RepID=A0A8H6ILS8_9PEZI|nr:hypothetical protein CMUS01_16782 [Colletotrichum musicola]
MERSQDLRACLRADIIEPAEKWFRYLVPDCPAGFRDLTGARIPLESQIRPEVKEKTGRDLRDWRITKAGLNPATDSASIIVSFLEPVPEGFRLFGQSGPARLLAQRKRALALHDPGCQGYHDSRFCRRNPRCGHCGSPGCTLVGGSEQCPEAPRCANCWGPHPAKAPECPARPQAGGNSGRPLTKRELQRIRKAGAAASAASQAAQTGRSPSPTGSVRDTIIVVDAQPLPTRPLRGPTWSRVMRETGRPLGGDGGGQPPP